MKMSARSLGLIGLLGGVGGAINAWLCFAKFPIFLIKPADVHNFSWPIVPAGIVHGALLGLISVGAVRIVWRQRALIQWVGLPLSGWVAGWFSGVPRFLVLHQSASERQSPAQYYFRSHSFRKLHHTRL